MQINIEKKYLLKFKNLINNYKEEDKIKVLLDKLQKIKDRKVKI